MVCILICVNSISSNGIRIIHFLNTFFNIMMRCELLMHSVRRKAISASWRYGRMYVHDCVSLCSHLCMFQWDTHVIGDCCLLSFGSVRVAQCGAERKRGGLARLSSAHPGCSYFLSPFEITLISYGNTMSCYLRLKWPGGSCCDMHVCPYT